MTRLILGDCVEMLKTLPDGSVHCAVTSPPYWSLRDYGVDGQIGLEATPDAFVARMVEVFREVRRVLRDDGTLWLNLGDSFASQGGQRKYGSSDGGTGRANQPGPRISADGLKPKDLVGIPWRVAFALQADGWWLRSDIIWAKPNPMPESVRDRPTKSHEYLFLMSKAERYYFDAEAVREPYIQPLQKSRSKDDYSRVSLRADGGKHCGASNPAGRNIRSVWTVATRAYKGCHFATFPPKLVEPCIKAGTSERGCCPDCGKPWERETRPTAAYAEKLAAVRNGLDWYQRKGDGNGNPRCGGGKQGKPEGGVRAEYETIGWRPTCTHGLDPVPCTVLDPFMGSGTTGAVAIELGRDFIGIELNPAYLALAEARLAEARSDHPLFAGVAS